jgi:outer membrane protein assembly factor BamB
MRTRHRVSLAALLAALLGAVAAGPAAGSAGPPDWTHDGYGPGNGGYNPDESWIVPARLGALAKQWSIAATGREVCARQAAPVVAGGRLFLAGRESLGAYDAGTGKKIWTYPYADPMDTRTPLLAVSGDTLLAGTSGCQSVSDPDGVLLALDAASGKPRWQGSTEAPDQTMVVDRGVAVVSGSDAGWMASTAFRISTGKQIWQRARAMPAAGASAGGTVLLTDYTNAFAAVGARAVDITTGAVRWRTGRIWSARAADPTGRSFLVDDPAGALLRVDAATGRVAWTQPGLAGPLAVDARQVYVARTAGAEVAGARVAGTTAELVSLAVGSGRVTWRRGGYQSLLRPVVAGGVLYAVTPQKRLDSLNAATGRVLGFSATDKPADHPVVAGDWLYLTDGSRLGAYTVPRIGCSVADGADC